ncbi:MAG: DUF952 domain-containing protein [Planctomycetes bacterium]|nr:DUF952 domain-containing protein [Planctomycetota bacterium]
MAWKEKPVRRIYHLVPKAVWEQVGAGPYRPASLASEGFIHCSHHHQVAWAANRFYAEEPELLVLDIDPDLLGSRVVDEPGDTGEHFPHIYGPLERAAVTQVRPLQRGPDGRWTFPGERETETTS